MMLERIKEHLIVSCQALEDEPLHSSFIMSRMALAAYQGGAKGIRANSIADIQEIKKTVDLPIIGIVKEIMIIVMFILHRRIKMWMTWLKLDVTL